MDLLTTEQAATKLGLSERTLEAWRFRGEGPPFLRVGPRRWPTPSTTSTRGFAFAAATLKELAASEPPRSDSCVTGGEPVRRTRGARAPTPPDNTQVPRAAAPRTRKRPTSPAAKQEPIGRSKGNHSVPA